MIDTLGRRNLQMKKHREWVRTILGLVMCVLISALVQGCVTENKTVRLMYCSVDQTKDPDKCYKNFWCKCPPGSVP
jgi:hypothetical protein